MEIASKFAALTLASRTSARTFSTFNPLYQSKFTYTPSDSFSTTSASETPAATAKPKTAKTVRPRVQKAKTEAADGGATSEPLTLSYSAKSQPLKYFKAVTDTEKSKVAENLLSLSDKWADMKENQRERYFEVFEMARLEYEERAKSEPKMAADAKVKARTIRRVLNEKAGKPKKPISAWTMFYAEQSPTTEGATAAPRMKALSAKWSSLSAAEKQPYEAKAEKAKAAYKAELDAWKRS